MFGKFGPILPNIGKGRPTLCFAAPPLRVAPLPPSSVFANAWQISFGFAKHWQMQKVGRAVPGEPFAKHWQKSRDFAEHWQNAGNANAIANARRNAIFAISKTTSTSIWTPTPGPAGTTEGNANKGVEAP